MKHWKWKLRRFIRQGRRAILTIKEQKAASLLETLVALALLGIVGVAFLVAVNTATITMATTEKKVDINNLARTQLEYIKDCAYDPLPYQTLDQLDPSDPYAIVMPDDYSINATATQLEVGIREVTVTIFRDGEELLVLKGYKVDR